MAAFIVEAVVIGLPNAFGVFLAAYLKNPVLASQKHASNLLPLIGTVSSSVIYFSGIHINSASSSIRAKPLMSQDLFRLLCSPGFPISRDHVGGLE